MLSPSTDGQIHALESATGAILWSLPGAGTSSLTNQPFGADIGGVTVEANILAASSLSGWLIVYDLVTRRERARANVRSGGTAFAPRVRDGDVYDILANGHLAAASIDGNLRWSRGDLSTAYFGQPVVASDRLFVSGKTGFWALTR